MGEIEGSYRAVQTPGTRLGAQFNAGISTLEPGQSLSAVVGPGGKGPGRGLQLRVQTLDESQEFYDMVPRADGQTLLTEVFKRSNLIESDYFGLEFQNMQMNWVWLEPTKLIVKQMRRPRNTLLRLSVKFFPPDPGQLQEEHTRYLFSLQMKRDLLEGRLVCTENTATLLASHLVQSEIGDYDDVADGDFLRLNKLLPNQERLQERIMELHRRHLGQTPAESDFQVLEIARKLEMYGVRFHPAADREGTKINLAVAHIGLQVFQGNTKINTFNWSKIRKLSFKRKRFLIKLHTEVHGHHQDTLEFLMASRDQCKVFWKNCVEHHAFFRLFDQPQPKTKAIFFSRGSSFRYSGRTEKQLVEYVRDNGARRTPYQRRNSKVMSTRSLAADMPKQSFSLNDSLQVPASPSSATMSLNFLNVSSPPPPSAQQNWLQSTPLQSQAQSPQPPVQQNQILAPQLSKPPSPPAKEDPHKATGVPPYHHAFLQGAPSSPAAGDCSPLFLCVDARSSQRQPSQNGIEDSFHGHGGQRTGFFHRGGGEMRDLFTAQPFEVGPMHAKLKSMYSLADNPLHLTEEYIDDDPTEISFYGGRAETYYGYEEKGGQHAGYDEGDGGGETRCYSLGLENLNGNNSFSQHHSIVGESDTSSLVNNRSECSSLDNLGPSSAGDSLSLGFGGPDSSSSLRLPGSDNPSGASSLVNFPACSVRSETSSAVQFSDIVEQLEQLSHPATATEGSANGSSDSDWGSDSGLPPEQMLFYSNPLTDGPGGVEGFLLQCHNLQALALGESSVGTPHMNM
ncbi:hypothetical protein DPEC_G00342580 [Dallia pectoralis]|uniref:Uncharacterized protein n=1 Tax=Dallia pectoralis TaxID=75939 RepID=A0ACC2F5P9_DALPE|nr:hypothetical protein DPEC_G00342580 [Dallia pectoralis]